MIIVSGCLAGIACRYDGKAKENKKIAQLVKEKKALTACPECMGGLKSPKEPSEIVGGDGYDVLDGKAKVISRDGKDVTAQFLKGAQKFLEYSQNNGATVVYLKKKSPSCGCGEIYDGSFSGKLKKGDGVTAALLKRNGIETAGY